MADYRFNNYSLTDDEVLQILKQYEKIIIEKATINGKRNEDCEQEIKIQIYKTLTKNRKNKKNKKN